MTPDGSGDAPFLRAAMDSTSPGDTVLLAPGEYEIGSTLVSDGIVLTSEQGALETRIVPQAGTIGGLACNDLAITTEISGLWFEGFVNVPGGVGAISDFNCVDIRILQCVFTGNDTGIAVNTGFGTRIEGNTFVNNTLALDVYFGTGVCRNNIVWDSVRGLQSFAFVICNDVLRLDDVPPMFRFANFSLDPQFCSNSDYRLMAGSPCAPGNTPLNDDCGLIGALPVNCSPTAVQERTWGQVKALYLKRP